MIDVRTYGAPTDGVTDATSAIQAAINYSRSFPNGGPPVLLSGGCDYVIDGTLDAYSSVPLVIQWEAGTRLLCRMSGAAAVGLRGTHPTNPLIRGKGLRLIDPNMEVHSSIAAGSVGPVLFEHRNASGLVFQGTGRFLHYRDNTAIRISTAWNCDFCPVSIWGAGKHWPHKLVPTTTFTIAKDATSLLASAPTFDASDVGHSLVIDWGNGRQKFTIVSVQDATHATTLQTSAVSFPNRPAAFDGVKGAITAGTNTLLLDAPVATTADVGRPVYVLGAAVPLNGGVSALRATITAVTDASHVVLDTNAGVTVTAAYVIPSPGVDIFSMDLDANKTNDLEWQSLHMEQFRGTGLAVQNAVGLRMYGPKLHAQNGVYDATASTFNAMFDSIIMATLTGAEIEGTAHNDLGRIYVGGLFGMFAMAQTQGAATVDERLVYVDAGWPASVVSVTDYMMTGDFATGAYAARTVANMVSGNNTGRILVNGAAGIASRSGV